ncbi:glycosyltransferase WbuB [Winogradskyella sp. PC-19]|uniref:glycosyltransferase family 4 protein n=1 Tax=unclassified Winogradskyella TaxID=2615021 RepID=UPI000B3D1458|nr:MULTISPECIES: glycosyltransferase family 4 protein [unclassified Winogradskyella]ARV09677.1 glycosyltransferase WbuB [Winogradskyella sp. PC-19]RZN84170.1 MAG: glycosyltransferase WbuB [Winogradskyella sp.]
MKEVLIISNYFPPEIGAASNRIFQLAKGLSKNHNVSVICPLPNYPTGKVFENYNAKETINNISVNRLWVSPSVSKNKFIRLFSMLSFSFSISWYILWNKIPETVIVNSPPLLVAFTSLFFLRSKRHKLILNVSDLWPSAGFELGAIKKGFSYNVLQKLESFNYKKAHLILGQSEEILTHIKTTVPQKETLLYRNFPDFEPPKIHTENPKDSTKIKLVYAGLLGIAQGVLKLCNKLDYSNIEFHIYGAGAEEIQIKSFLKKNPNLPIFFHGSVGRKQLHKELMKYDATIIPLLNRIYGSVPSKIFEYSRLGLPIIYFGGGEGETVVEKNKLGWVAEAGNYEALNSILNNLKASDFSTGQKQKIQKTAIANFENKHQIEAFENLI